MVVLDARARPDRADLCRELRHLPWRTSDDLDRIRDVETGPDGHVYLLLEHADGARIVRLVPGWSAGRPNGRTRM